MLTVAGPGAGVGLAALPPVRDAIGNGHESKTIYAVLRQARHRRHRSPMVIDPDAAEPQLSGNILPGRIPRAVSVVHKEPERRQPERGGSPKPVCFVFDFAPTRALRLIADYGAGLSPEAANPEDAVKELVNFLPVLTYDGSHMTQVDAGGILDIAMAGTSATLLARKWESALLVNVDNDTLRKILANPKALEAVMKIEGFRALGSDIFETVINKSEEVRATKKEKGEDITSKEKRELSEEEKEYKSKRKQIQDDAGVRGLTQG